MKTNMRTAKMDPADYIELALTHLSVEKTREVSRLLLEEMVQFEGRRRNMVDILHTIASMSPAAEVEKLVHTNQHGSPAFGVGELAGKNGMLVCAKKTSKAGVDPIDSMVIAFVDTIPPQWLLGTYRFDWEEEY